jgi:hypothetical protein
MAIDPAKAKDDLALRIHQARNRADAYIDAKAEELAKTSPGVPVGVLRQTICRGGNCPCSYALTLLDEEKGA